MKYPQYYVSKENWDEYLCGAYIEFQKLMDKDRKAFESWKALNGLTWDDYERERQYVWANPFIPPGVYETYFGENQ